MIVECNPYFTICCLDNSKRIEVMRRRVNGDNQCILWSKVAHNGKRGNVVVSTVANSNDDITGCVWRDGVLGRDKTRRDWLSREVCVARLSARLG